MLYTDIKDTNLGNERKKKKKRKKKTTEQGNATSTLSQSATEGNNYKQPASRKIIHLMPS
jgi:hypothetical protein